MNACCVATSDDMVEHYRNFAETVYGFFFCEKINKFVFECIWRVSTNKRRIRTKSFGFWYIYGLNGYSSFDIFMAVFQVLLITQCTTRLTNFFFSLRFGILVHATELGASSLMLKLILLL